MKFMSLIERFNRCTDERPAITSVGVLMSQDYLGLWDRSYWTMRIHADAAFYVKTLNGLLNKADDAAKPQIAQEIRDFLELEEVKNGFEEAPKDCGLSILNTRIAKLLKPDMPPVQAAAIRLTA